MRRLCAMQWRAAWSRRLLETAMEATQRSRGWVSGRTREFGKYCFVPQGALRRLRPMRRVR